MCYLFDCRALKELTKLKLPSLSLVEATLSDKDSAPTAMLSRCFSQASAGCQRELESDESDESEQTVTVTA